MLLISPWKIKLDRSTGFPFDQANEIQIANPTGFLAHKILIQDRRRRTKFAKDILYIHDTLDLFGKRLPELNDQWKRQIKFGLHQKIVRKIEHRAARTFQEVNDAIREAAQMATIRQISPESIRELCHFGLKRVFS